MNRRKFLKLCGISAVAPAVVQSIPSTEPITPEVIIGQIIVSQTLDEYGLIIESMDDLASMAEEDIPPICRIYLHEGYNRLEYLGQYDDLRR